MSRRPRPAGLVAISHVRATVATMTGGLAPGSFARSVLVLAAGGAVGQAIGVAASPVITRLYSPVDLGTLSVYTSLLSLLAVAVSLKYEQAIPMPALDDEGRNLLAVALTVSLSVGLLTALGVAVFGDQIALWTNSPGLMPWLWLLPISVSAVGTFEALSLWAVRIREFSLIAWGKVSQNIGQVAAQIAFGLLRVGPAGLIVGDSGSRAAAGALLSRLLSNRADLLGGVSRVGMRTVAVQYRRFALVASLSGLVNSAVGNFPPLILATLYGPGAAGYFALGRLVIFAPFGLLGNSIARVYMSRVTRARNEAPGSLMSLLTRVTIRLSLSLPLFAVLFLVAPTLFPLIFGKVWAEVGVYTQILCPALALDFIFQTTSVLISLRFVGQQLAWDIVRLVAALGGMLVAHASGADATTAILVYSLALSLSYILLFLMSVRVIRRHFPSDASGASQSASG
jgi:O-antigen/teichoic acid export membrane protein